MANNNHDERKLAIIIDILFCVKKEKEVGN